MQLNDLPGIRYRLELEIKDETQLPMGTDNAKAYCHAEQNTN